MKIVMIGPFGLRPKGTMSVRALPLARSLASRGHSVFVILPPWNYPADSGMINRADGRDDRQYRPAAAHPRRLPSVVAWRLVRVALAQKPDVVHCFKPKAYAGLAALLIWCGRCLHLTGVRLVVDSDDWEGAGGWNDRERYTRPQKAFFSWQERWGLTHNDAVTVASRTLQSLAWSMGVPPEPCSLCSQWRRRAPVIDRRSARPASPTLLLYTRFFEFAVERVVDIVRRSLAAVPERRLVVLGAGLFGEETTFLAQVAALGLSDRIEYAGWREPAELPFYFAAADVAIYPFDDTLINRAKCAVKLIDLLAAGVAVVADNVGQNAEYIEHGESGVLVTPGDTASFVDWVVRLLGDRDLSGRLGDRARRRMNDHFSWGISGARS